ncbi:MAG: hypothetical protein J4F36_13875 [Nitrosopumilaceae archaeon]|nr:hypothetical protein [Nitrosopumilaceae archaeon]
MKCFECHEGELEEKFFKVGDDTPFEIDMSKFPDGLSHSKQMQNLGKTNIKKTLICNKCDAKFIGF